MVLRNKDVAVEGGVVTSLSTTLGSAALEITDKPLEKKSEALHLKDLDDLFPYIGEFGWYQRLLFLMMLPYGAFFAVVYFAQIFMTVTPAEYWCTVPELVNLTLEERRHLSIPRTLNGSFEKCVMFDVEWDQVMASGVRDPDPTWKTASCRYGYEFNFTDIPYKTIATQLGWVCEREQYVATAQAVFFCGSILGGLIFGWVGDKYGRVPALLGTNLVAFAGGISTAFCYDFWSFCLCRFFVGLAYDNCFMIMYIVVVEYIGPKWRTLVANLSFGVFFTGAACALPWIAIASNDWRLFSLITSAPLALALITPCVVPESARWLISQGRIDDALKMLNRFETVNRKKIPDAVIKEFRETAIEMTKTEQEAKAYSVLDLFQTPRLRRHSITLVVLWVTIAMVFDGHVRSAGAFGLDMFLTFTIATATELPADLLLIGVLNLTGRRWLTFSTMVIGGLFCFVVTVVPFGLPSAGAGIAGRFAVNIAYNLGMQFAAELLPTVARAQGLSLIHIAGYIATVLVPYIIYLGTFASYIPLIILGCLGLLGGFSALLLPDTTGEKMPQSLCDGEELGLHQGFWDFPYFVRKKKNTKNNKKQTCEFLKNQSEMLC